MRKYGIYKFIIENVFMDQEKLSEIGLQQQAVEDLHIFGGAIELNAVEMIVESIKIKAKRNGLVSGGYVSRATLQESDSGL